MMRYAFNSREKVLLAALGVLLILVAWYFLVFQNTQSMITDANNDAEDAKTEITAAQGRLTSMQTMQKAIDDAKAQGIEPADYPEYDNIRNVMTELNNVLAGTTGYSLAFDDIVDDESGLVRRGADITFGCDDFAAAEDVVRALASGTYPCSIDSLDVAQGGTGRSILGSSSRAAAAAAVNVKIHVTFYETRSAS